MLHAVTQGASGQQVHTLDGPVTLENGDELQGVTVAFETWGTLDAAKGNAILICHALTGDSHAASGQDGDTPGWWETMVGPGRAIDTDRYFVICSNVLGGCMGTTGPSSVNPETGRPFGTDFPVVTIGDMVRVQAALVDHLGIDRLHAVIGGSVGGMQVLSWCRQFPERVGSGVALATTMRHSALSIAFNEVARQSIVSDPNWNKGHYYGGESPALGLSVARMIGHITYLSDDAMHRKFGRRLQDRDEFAFDFDAEFQVESYLHYQGAKFVDRFDANSLLYITKAADYFDIEQGLRDSGALGRMAELRHPFLVVSYTSDWLYPTYQNREIVSLFKRYGVDVSFCEIEASCGHDAFLLPSDRLTTILTGFLGKGDHA
ncbi:homoserine O-acetyltransferase MetX [Desulfoluna spongiiphila]|uniref:homoserine O-acetyltransferase MetX n=1 Tax=Desulfoluna spongiiphila TaxID=419481 RepID=UPI0012532503|nr:homoserine O-acetyltransferase [Desulfoluna spongiiphila]VVS93472.1 alpha/beta hydrolase fold [Desulfoluna spongiiphila]